MCSFVFEISSQLIHYHLMQLYNFLRPLYQKLLFYVKTKYLAKAVNPPKGITRKSLIPFNKRPSGYCGINSMLFEIISSQDKIQYQNNFYISLMTCLKFFYMSHHSCKIILFNKYLLRIYYYVPDSRDRIVYKPGKKKKKSLHLENFYFDGTSKRY